MSAHGAMAGLAALAMLSGVSISFGGRERQPPREKTDEDRARIAAAELKRARKNARRLGLVRSDEADDITPVKYKRVTPDAELYASVHHEDDGSFSWEVVSYTDGGCERNSHARSAASTFFIEEAELAALRALPDAVAQLTAAMEDGQ